MNVDFLKKQITEMDVKGDDFFEIYKLVSEKYWDFKNPDEMQKASKLLHLIAERGESYEREVIFCTKVLMIFIPMIERNEKAGHAAMTLNEQTYYVDIYTDKTELAAMAKVLANTVTVKAKEEKK